MHFKHRITDILQSAVLIRNFGPYIALYAVYCIHILYTAISMVIQQVVKLLQWGDNTIFQEQHYQNRDLEIVDEQELD